MRWIVMIKIKAGEDHLGIVGLSRGSLMRRKFPYNEGLPHWRPATLFETELYYNGIRNIAKSLNFT